MINRLFYKNKNNKVEFYIINYIRQLIPVKFHQKRLEGKLKSIESFNNEEIRSIRFRVEYYNKLVNSIDLSSTTQKLSDLTIKNSLKTYYFDLYEYSRYFNQILKGHFLFGDITHIPQEPSFVKSRPILGDNANSVVLKLNKVRHFLFIKNDKRFSEKKNKLVFRGSVLKEHPGRIRFLEKYFNHPMCDVGMANDNALDAQWLVDKMSIGEQLEYKFILSLEGNDVASNLKWIMSSNSLVVMPKPKFETWFMEGLLKPDYHYVLLKDDYSDLEEKLEYYINNPDAANCIIKQSNAYVAQFENKKIEDLISLMVLDKYFKKTNQYN
ncbi:glycosyl transferase family 90 [Aurantibacter sp.]|uniref:glycosyl transferase family 90 n=1 Tax=Aurantibacter sp. TaxID=2807103 RepID=UPI003265F43D